MGYAVVHMQKFSKGGVRGIQSHNNREHPPRTNPDIDTSRTGENYDLIYSENYGKSCKDSIEFFATETKTVRKDAVVYCSFIVTSDESTMKAMSPEKQRAFFEDSVKWFAERYGGENIVNATVHMDEKTPHMHIGVVPITADGRLSAKTLFDKKELISIQTDFVRQVGEGYGLERGKEGSPDKHIEPLRHKQKVAEEKVVHAQGEYDRIRAKAEEIGESGKKEYLALKAMREERQALEGQIQALQADLRGRQLLAREINDIRPQKAFGGAVKGVTVEDIENLKTTARSAVELAQQLTEVTRSYQQVKSLVPTMDERMKQGKDKARLEQLEKVFAQLPVEVQTQLLPDRSKSRGDSLGHER